MKPSELTQLDPGRVYATKLRWTNPENPKEHRIGNRVLRIFKRLEYRFGDIPCAVFSASTRNFGREVSVPHYDLAACYRV